MVRFLRIHSFLILFLLIFVKESPSETSNHPSEWIVHYEEINILSIEEVIEIVNTKSASMIDSYIKNEKPSTLDKKKWFPPKRYSIPGSIWLPNIGRETLTIDQRKYLETGLEKITKNDKSKEIVFFCRRGYYSKIAAERAVKLGYKNVSMFPGTDLWEDGGQRLVILKELSFN